MIERLKVRITAGAVGEYSFPELTLCADLYSVSVPPMHYCSGTSKTPVIMPKVQVVGYACRTLVTIEYTAASFDRRQRRQSDTYMLPTSVL